MEAKILVNVDGFGTSELRLDLVDGGAEVEVWCARFVEEFHPGEVLAEVYFEMVPDDYEVWSLVSAAMVAYRLEVL